MSTALTQPRDIGVPDTGGIGSDIWSNKLYRIGGIAAAVAALLTPISVSVFAIWPPPEYDAGARVWFEHIQDNKLLGLLSLDLPFLIITALRAEMSKAKVLYESPPLEVDAVLTEIRAAFLELVFRDPLRRRVWKARSEFPIPRHLERGKSIDQVRCKLGGINRASCTQHDVCLDLLAHVEVRDGRDRTLHDVGMVAQRELDLGRRNVLAAAPDHLLASAT
jgi:hypothetical protein